MLSSHHKINFHADGVLNLEPSVVDQDLRASILQCIRVQKESAQQALASFKPYPLAMHEVSEDRLQQILAQGDDIHGIASDRSISNVIPFSAPHIADAVCDTAVDLSRQDIDKRMAKLVKNLFSAASGLRVTSSGHLWYPPGAYMGWHTNSKVPGWRVYVNYAEQEGRSFFRYRDPDTHEIVTLNDQQWNIRIFKIDRDKPLWHAVYSDTHRFSMGYMLYKESLLARLRGKIKRLPGR